MGLLGIRECCHAQRALARVPLPHHLVNCAFLDAVLELLPVSTTAQGRQVRWGIAWCHRVKEGAQPQ